MEIALVIGAIIAAIFFGIIIKEFWIKQQRGEIVVYRNVYDMFFNAIVYILPAVVFCIDKPSFDKPLCYVLLCIGFTIFMCVSAWDSNDTIGNKINASLVKIITGIEVPLTIVIILLVLALIFGGKDRDRRNRNNYNYNYRRKW